jgi:hypothetical protein
MDERPDFLSDFLWSAYLQSGDNDKEKVAKLIFSSGMESAWREINKRTSDIERINAVCRGLLSIFKELGHIQSQAECIEEMHELNKISRKLSLLLDSIESKYNREFIKDFSLFHYTTPDIRCFERNPDFKKTKPHNRTIKISDHLRFLSSFAENFTNTKDLAWYLSLDVKKGKGNPKRVYVIRRIAVLLKFNLGSVLHGTCANFASAILGGGISIDQVKDSLRRFDGIKSKKAGGGQIA